MSNPKAIFESIDKNDFVASEESFNQYAAELAMEAIEEISEDVSRTFLLSESEKEAYYEAKKKKAKYEDSDEDHDDDNDDDDDDDDDDDTITESKVKVGNMVVEVKSKGSKHSLYVDGDLTDEFDSLAEAYKAVEDIKKIAKA